MLRVSRDIEKFERILRFLQRKIKRVRAVPTLKIPRYLPQLRRLKRIKELVGELGKLLIISKGHKLTQQYRRPSRKKKSPLSDRKISYGSLEELERFEPPY